MTYRIFIIMGIWFAASWVLTLLKYVSDKEADRSPIYFVDWLKIFWVTPILAPLCFAYAAYLGIMQIIEPIFDMRTWKK